MTKHRRVILETLTGTDTHPSADRIYMIVRGRIPDISLGTVYRNLEALSASGVIQKLSTGGGRKLYDGRPELHHHLLCLDCGAVSDAPEGAVNVSYNSEKLRGFEVTGYSFMLSGKCLRCINEKKEKTDGT